MSDMSLLYLVFSSWILPFERLACTYRTFNFLC